MSIFGQLASGLGTGLGQAFTTLTTTGGLTASAAHSVITQLMGNSIGSQETPFLHVIVAQYKNAGVVQDQVNKALEIDGLSAQVSDAISELPALAAAAAASPVQGLGNFFNVIGGIEKELGINS